MKPFIYFFASLIISALIWAPNASSQEIPDHVNVGVFGNYVRLNDGDLNLLGVGGRLSVNVFPYVQLEAESAYNFDQAFTQGFTNSSNGSVSIGRTDVRSLDGLFGPILMTNKGPVCLLPQREGL